MSTQAPTIYMPQNSLSQIQQNPVITSPPTAVVIHRPQGRPKTPPESTVAVAKRISSSSPLTASLLPTPSESSSSSLSKESKYVVVNEVKNQISAPSFQGLINTNSNRSKGLANESKTPINEIKNLHEEKRSTPTIKKRPVIELGKGKTIALDIIQATKIIRKIDNDGKLESAFFVDSDGDEITYQMAKDLQMTSIEYQFIPTVTLNLFNIIALHKRELDILGGRAEEAIHARHKQQNDLLDIHTRHQQALNMSPEDQTALTEKHAKELAEARRALFARHKGEVTALNGPQKKANPLEQAQELDLLALQHQQEIEILNGKLQRTAILRNQTRELDILEKRQRGYTRAELLKKHNNELQNHRDILKKHKLALEKLEDPQDKKMLREKQNNELRSELAQIPVEGEERRELIAQHMENLEGIPLAINKLVKQVLSARDSVTLACLTLGRFQECDLYPTSTEDYNTRRIQSFLSQAHALATEALTIDNLRVLYWIKIKESQENKEKEFKKKPLHSLFTRIHDLIREQIRLNEEDDKAREEWITKLTKEPATLKRLLLQKIFNHPKTQKDSITWTDWFIREEAKLTLAAQCTKYARYIRSHCWIFPDKATVEDEAEIKSGKKQMNREMLSAQEKGIEKLAFNEERATKQNMDDVIGILTSIRVSQRDCFTEDDIRWFQNLSEQNKSKISTKLLTCWNEICHYEQKRKKLIAAQQRKKAEEAKAAEAKKELKPELEIKKTLIEKSLAFIENAQEKIARIKKTLKKSAHNDDAKEIEQTEAIVQIKHTLKLTLFAQEIETSIEELESQLTKYNEERDVCQKNIEKLQDQASLQTAEEQNNLKNQLAEHNKKIEENKNKIANKRKELTDLETRFRRDKEQIQAYGVTLLNELETIKQRALSELETIKQRELNELEAIKQRETTAKKRKTDTAKAIEKYRTNVISKEVIDIPQQLKSTQQKLKDIRISLQSLKKTSSDYIKDCLRLLPYPLQPEPLQREIDRLEATLSFEDSLHSEDVENAKKKRYLLVQLMKYKEHIMNERELNDGEETEPLTHETFKSTNMRWWSFKETVESLDSDEVMLGQERSVEPKRLGENGQLVIKDDNIPIRSVDASPFTVKGIKMTDEELDACENEMREGELEAYELVAEVKKLESQANQKKSGKKTTHKVAPAKTAGSIAGPTYATSAATKLESKASIVSSMPSTVTISSINPTFTGTQVKTAWSQNATFPSATSPGIPVSLSSVPKSSSLPPKIAPGSTPPMPSLAPPVLLSSLPLSSTQTTSNLSSSSSSSTFVSFAPPPKTIGTSSTSTQAQPQTGHVQK